MTITKEMTDAALRAWWQLEPTDDVKYADEEFYRHSTEDMRRAIEAVDAVRERLRRENCQHLNRRGSGGMSSDGSGHMESHCPDCGKSWSEKWPARPRDFMTALPQNAAN